MSLYQVWRLHKRFKGVTAVFLLVIFAVVAAALLGGNDYYAPPFGWFDTEVFFAAMTAVTLVFGMSAIAEFTTAIVLIIAQLRRPQ